MQLELISSFGIFSHASFIYTDILILIYMFAKKKEWSPTYGHTVTHLHLSWAGSIQFDPG